MRIHAYSAANAHGKPNGSVQPTNDGLALFFAHDTFSHARHTANKAFQHLV